MSDGVTEVQLQRLVIEAGWSRSAPGEKLIELLERRLDNVIFRAGFARPIPAARQLICHGFVEINGQRMDILSFRVSRDHATSKTRPHFPLFHGLLREASFQVINDSS